MDTESNEQNRENFAEWKAPIDEQPEQDERKQSKLAKILNSPTGKFIRRSAVYAWAGLMLAGGVEIGRNVIQLNKEATKIMELKDKDENRQKQYEQQFQFVIEKVGRDRAKKIAKSFLVEQKIKDDTAYPEVANFQEIGLKDEDVARLLSEKGSYPEGWINGEVGSIEMIDKKYDEGATAATHGIVGSDIEIEKSALGEDDPLRSVDFYFAHEVGHANDWETDKDATFQERIALLARVIKQVDETDIEKMYNFSYLHFNSEEEKNWVYAKEVWATMCEAYFTSPEYLQKLYPEAFNVVDDWVKRTDPDFDPEKAIQYKNETIENIHSKSE